MTEAGSLLAAGNVLAGRYRIVRLLGVGGMGAVYQAEDQRLGLPIAIKVLQTELGDERVLQGRLRQELLAGRQISHQGVVRIHDLDRDGELTFLTMDYVAGRSLRDLLKERGRLPLEEAVTIQIQLAAALAAAHEAGVVHRDLKPANILLDDDHGKAHIADFGLASTLSSSGLTRTGDVVGTPEYLAPEQAQSQPVDHRTDIYALGLIFFRMLTGEFAFSGNHVGERLAQRISSRPRRLSDAGVEAPEYLEAILARCLARDPQERYQSAVELSADLEAHRPPVARPRRLSRKKVVMAGFLVLAAAALVGVSLGTKDLVSGLLESFGRAPTPEPTAETAASRPAPRYAVAILPLAESDAEGADPAGWLPAALPEMLSSSLSESPDLRVVDSVRVARTLQDLRLPAGRLPESELSVIAKLLKVDRIVVPRVWAVGDSVHTELQLIDPGNPQAPKPVVRDNATGPDVLGLPARLAETLRDRLDAQPPAHMQPVASSSAAMAAYAKGIESLTRGDSLGALPWLERAVREEPTFTDAWVSLARTHQSLGQRQQALDAARKAVEQSAGGAGRTGFEARARLASLQGQPETTQALLEELVEQYPHDVEARILLSEAYGDAGELSRADRVLEEVILDDPHHPRAWYLRGRYAILAGAVQRAADDFLVRALVVQNRLDNHQGRADVLNALGAAHQMLGELDRAEERYGEAVAIRREIGDRRGAAATLSNLANIRRLRGRLDEARTHLEEALSLCLELDYRQGMAAVENELGLLEEQRGLYARALEHFHNALVLRRELEDRADIAESHGNIGFADFILGDYEDAGLHLREALELYRQTDHHTGEAETLQLMAQLAMAQGRWEESLAANLQALGLARDMKMPQLAVVATAHLGRVAQLRGRYAAALSSYGEAMELLAELEDLRGWTEVTLYQADALIEIGLLDQAIEKLEQADPWIESTGHRDHLAERLRLEAEIEHGLGQLDRAHELLAEAEQAAQASGARVIQLHVELGAGRLELATGKPELAVRILRSVLQSADRLGHAALRTEAGAALAEAERASGRADEAERTVRKTLEITYASPPMAIAGRLHLLLSELLEARGATDAALEELERAQAEMERLREGLDPSQQTAFDRLPEVQAIERRSPA